MTTSLNALFAEQRSLFASKGLLRRLYCEDFFVRLKAACIPGTTVEIGSGPGLLKQAWPEIIATDIFPSNHLNVVSNACHLPWKNDSIANIAGLDVLHHLSAPRDFLWEVQRVLKPGGRLVLIEPWLTPFSRFIYQNFHQEDCDESVKVAFPFSSGKSPMQGNQAIPFMIFSTHLPETLRQLPRMSLKLLESFGGLAYLLSLGFKPGTLAPGWMYPHLQAFEKKTLPLWRKMAALRILVVMEKLLPKLSGDDFTR